MQPGGNVAPRADGARDVSPNTACNSVTSDGTATANELAFFNSPCNVEGSATIVESNGKVGIGTASPVSTLEVKGATTLLGTLKLNAQGAATSSAGARSFPVSLGAASFNSSTSASVPQTFQWQAQAGGE